MPARGKNDTLQRLLTLLKAIPVGKPGRETGELLAAVEAAGYRIHARSLQRDLASLMDVLPLGCDERARPYRWYWTGNDAIGVAALSTPEALALVLVEQHLTQALPGQMTSSFKSLFERAHARLKSLGPNNRQPRWLKKVRSISPVLPVIRPAIDPRVQAAVGEALMNEHQLDVDYRSMSSARSKWLTLNPLALILRGELLYLVATAKGHDDVRFYAVHRIKSAVERMSPANAPAGFDVDRALADGLGQFHGTPGRSPRMKLVLRCAEWLVRQLEETPLALDQKITPVGGGMADVSATVPKSWQLNWWVLARMESTEVMAPAEYRKEIGDLLRRGADRYRSEQFRRAA